MIRIVFFIIVIGAAIHLYLRHQQSVLNPEVITDPIYAEVRMNLAAGNRTLEMVLFAKTVNQDECRKFSDGTVKKLFDHEASGGDLHWKTKSSECKTELSSRYAKLFENEPTFVTYLSMARGDPKEREMRLIYWGVSVPESDKVCEVVPELQKQWRGAVTCIRASKS